MRVICCHLAVGFGGLQRLSLRNANQPADPVRAVTASSSGRAGWESSMAEAKLEIIDYYDLLGVSLAKAERRSSPNPTKSSRKPTVAKLSERCSDCVEDQGAEDALRGQRENCHVSFGSLIPSERLCFQRVHSIWPQPYIALTAGSHTLTQG